MSPLAFLVAVKPECAIHCTACSLFSTEEAAIAGKEMAEARSGRLCHVALAFEHRKVFGDQLGIPETPMCFLAHSLGGLLMSM